MRWEHFYIYILYKSSYLKNTTRVNLYQCRTTAIMQRIQLYKTWWTSRHSSSSHDNPSGIKIKGCFDTQWTNRSSCPPKNEAFFPCTVQKFTILQFFSINPFLNLSKPRGVNTTKADRTMTAQSEKSIICKKPRLTALHAGIVLTPPLMSHETILDFSPLMHFFHD